MNIEQQLEHKWENETDNKRESLEDFLIGYLSAQDRNRKKYDSTSELHFSGGSADDLTKFTKGKLEISKIETLYNDADIEKIKVTIGSTEVLLSGQALADYLAKAE